MSSRIPTVIVSGFPGIGKTTAARQFPLLFRDLESSDYHWIVDENGQKCPNPEWPGNYIEAIKNLSHSGLYKSVFVSSHGDVRRLMKEAGVRYTNIFPDTDPEMKKIIIERFHRRGSPETFISDMNEHYEKYVESMAEDTGAVARVRLTPQAITEWSTWCAYV